VLVYQLESYPHWEEFFGLDELELVLDLVEVPDQVAGGCPASTFAERSIVEMPT
jgi:hypothetical protein